MKDSFKTVRRDSEGVYKEKGSKFLAYVRPVLMEEEFQQFMQDIKKLHSKARHHCYAYKFGVDGNLYRSNDDGEPSGTAGKPILGQIESFEITNVGIIIVRYFGGTKLGTGGLITAYRTAAKEALENNEIIEKEILKEFKILFDYKWMSDVLNALKKTEVQIFEKAFNEEAFIHFGIIRSQEAAVLQRMKALILKKSLEEIEEDTKIEGITITEIV